MRISDWSSDVCSADLFIAINRSILRPHRPLRITQAHDGPVGYALHRAGLGKAQDDVCFFGVRFVRRDDVIASLPDKRRQYLAHPGIVLIRQQATKGTNIAYWIRHRRKQRDGIDHFILPSLDQSHARPNTTAATQVRRWRHMNDIDDASHWIA